MMNSDARKRVAEQQQPEATDRDALRALAAEATGGTWGVASTEGMGFAVHRGEHETVALYLDRPNAAYIAAASPDRITALLDDLDAAERERREALARWSEVNGRHGEALASVDSWREEAGIQRRRAERAEAQVAAVEAVVEDDYAPYAYHPSIPAGDWAVLRADAVVETLRAALDTPADTPTEPDADERGGGRC